MKRELEALISTLLKEAYSFDSPIELTRPDEKFGDYATNVALQLAKQLSKNPRELAEEISGKIKTAFTDKFADVTVAGPGFINLRLTDKYLVSALQTESENTSLAGKQIVVEYSDPNPFKVLHAGHLYTSVVGDSIANLLEHAGAVVHRVNFGGDVGLHVGKTMWAMLKELGGENPEKLSDISEAERSEWMAKAYVKGTQAYDDNDDDKAAIIDLNKRVYEIHSDNDKDSLLAQIYWTTRQWSYDYFDAFYDRIGTHFEKYYPESATVQIGLDTVRKQLAKGVYQESDGAVIFEGEKYDLHTRVFINSEGLPTYEAKDVGLSMLKMQDYNFDKSIIITGNEQSQYMDVVIKSIEQFAPELAHNTMHLTHGMVKLKGGVKMSSRLGNFLRAVDVLDAASEAAKSLGKDAANHDLTVLGAIKYSFLKNRMGGDIIYDPEESVSVEGNSGPYLQYAHARARSIVRKAVPSHSEQSEESVSEILHSVLRQPADDNFDESERSLAVKITEYAEVFDKAVIGLEPHLIATYLYELAQVFNRFYEKNKVVGDPRQDTRLQLVELYSNRLKSGLGLLGITAPEKM